MYMIYTYVYDIYTNTKQLRYIPFRFNEMGNGVKSWRCKYKIVEMHPFKIYCHYNCSVDWIQCVSRSHLISVQNPDCRCLSENKQNTQGTPGNRDEMIWYLSIWMLFAQNHNNCRFHRIFKTYQFENSARRIQQFSQLLAEKIVTPDQHFVPIFHPYDQQRLRDRQKEKWK